MGILWENTTPSTELPRDFCAGFGSLQLGVVLVIIIITVEPLFYELPNNDVLLYPMKIKSTEFIYYIKTSKQR